MSVASRLGGALSPFVLVSKIVVIAKLKALFIPQIGCIFLQSAGNQAIPVCLMGLLSVLAGLCALKLPETKDSPTPDTLEELRAK